MPANKRWRDREIAKVLADERSAEEVARELGRTVSAVKQVRTMANMVKEGKGTYLSIHMRQSLQRFFTNRGNMQLEEHEAPNQAPSEEPVKTEEKAVDTCSEQMEALVQEAEKTFALLQEQMAKLARLQAAHQTHAIVTELSEVKQQYAKLEKEVGDLREFKRNAEQRGFGKMLRGAVPW